MTAPNYNQLHRLIDCITDEANRLDIPCAETADYEAALRCLDKLNWLGHALTNMSTKLSEDMIDRIDDSVAKRMEKLNRKAAE